MVLVFCISSDDVYILTESTNVFLGFQNSVDTAFILKFRNGHHSVKYIRRHTALTLRTLADDGLLLCQENVFNCCFKVINWIRFPCYNLSEDVIPYKRI